MPEFKTPESDEPGPVAWWELERAYQVAYGAVMQGMTWVGPDMADGVSQDEALEFAADFFRKAGYDFFRGVRRDV